jgi:hypothetical protein
MELGMMISESVVWRSLVNPQNRDGGRGDTSPVLRNYLTATTAPAVQVEPKRFPLSRDGDRFIARHTKGRRDK